MKDEKHLCKLLAEVTRLVKNHGPRSDEVRQFVKDHLDEEPELLELSATIIFMFEGKLDDDSKSAEVIKKVFSDDPELKDD